MLKKFHNIYITAIRYLGKFIETIPNIYLPLLLILQILKQTLLLFPLKLLYKLQSQYLQIVFGFASENSFYFMLIIIIFRDHIIV